MRGFGRRFCGEGRDLLPIQVGRSKLRDIATYLRSPGGIADIIDHWPSASGHRGILEISSVFGFARRPATRRSGAIYGQFREIGRNSAKSPPAWGDKEAFRTSLIVGRLRRIFGAPWKSRLFADSPADRFCGEGARFMANSGRSAEIPRNLRLIGAIRRNA